MEVGVGNITGQTSTTAGLMIESRGENSTMTDEPVHLTTVGMSSNTTTQPVYKIYPQPWVPENLPIYDQAIREGYTLCYQRYHNFTYPATDTYCPPLYDGVLCWGAIPAGTNSTIACPEQLHGVKYMNGSTSSKACLTDGVWAKAIYNCIEEDGNHKLTHSQTLTYLTVYIIAIVISLIVCIGAFTIFAVFYSRIKCLRNIIHMNLIASFILRNILQIMLFASVLMDQQSAESGNSTSSSIYCRALNTLFYYAVLTNFFWMFVEGLYLISLVFFAMSGRKRGFLFYCIIGWVIPIVITGIWLAVVSQYRGGSKCWTAKQGDKNYEFEYIIHAPIYTVMFINLVQMILIVGMLLTKLKASSNLETAQYRKAVKAIIVLLPLLGLTYALASVAPTHDQVLQLAFMYINALLQSTQGIMVSVVYCYMNSEVKTLVMKRFGYWKDTRNFYTTRTSRGPSLSMVETHQNNFQSVKYRIGQQQNFEEENGVSTV